MPDDEKNSKKICIELEDLPGIGPATAEKLRTAGYTDFQLIASANPYDLVEKADMKLEKAKEAIDAAKDSLQVGFETADILLERRKQMQKIPTGSKNLDELLGGGVETGAITEMYGRYGSGKCVAADTPLIYFNSSTAHVESISSVYENYKTTENNLKGGVASLPKRDVYVLSIDANGALTKKKIVALYREKVSEITRLETDRGTNLAVTDQHPLFTITDQGLQWKSTGLIQEGDYIGTTTVSYDSQSDITTDDAYFIGLFVAEGTANPFSISNFDQKIQEKLHAYIRSRFGREPSFRQERGLTLLFEAARPILSGLDKTNSATKHIPETVLNGSLEIQKAFLSGYADGDGYLCNCPEFTTKSKKLANQLSYLFSHLGIQCSLSLKTVKGNLFYRLFVTDQESKRNLITALSYATKDSIPLTPGSKRRANSHYGVPTNVIYPIIRRINSLLAGSRRRNMIYSKKEILSEKSEFSSLYSNYISRKPFTRVMTHDTLGLLLAYYDTRIGYLQKWKTELQGPTSEKLLSALTELPFSSKTISTRLSMRFGSFINYTARKRIPPHMVNPFATLLTAMINETLEHEQLKKDLTTLKILKDKGLSWERILSKKKEAYDDYVYDVEVEDTHNFIGGFKPMLLHNSQIGFQLCINSIKSLPQNGSGAHGVLFIDTEGTFRADRLAQIAEAAGLNQDEALKHIFVARAENSDHQILLIEKAPELIEKNNIKLIVVDSLTAHFRADYTGRGALSDRQQKLNKHLHLLLNIAERYNLAVYITNQVMDDPAMMFGDPTRPIGGNVVAHTTTYRVYLRKSKEEKRIARLVDSPHLPEAETVFRVKETGICD